MAFSTQAGVADLAADLGFCFCFCSCSFFGFCSAVDLDFGSSPCFGSGFGADFYFGSGPSFGSYFGSGSAGACFIAVVGWALAGFIFAGPDSGADFFVVAAACSIGPGYFSGPWRAGPLSFTVACASGSGCLLHCSQLHHRC